MRDLKYARKLIALAQKDIKALAAMARSQEFEDGIFGFHAQQGVEKALKAWIASLGIEYPLTHDIAVLLALLRANGIDTEQYRTLEGYTAFAVQFRYEDFSMIGECLDRDDILRHVTDLVTHVASIVSRDD